jgi:hypothetical protein
VPLAEPAKESGAGAFDFEDRLDFELEPIIVDYGGEVLGRYIKYDR